MNQDERLYLRLPAELKHRLQRIADKIEVSVSDLVREVIETEVKRLEKQYKIK
jgi:predicted DNA-binding protein